MQADERAQFIALDEVQDAAVQDQMTIAQVLREPFQFGSDRVLVLTLLRFGEGDRRHPVVPLDLRSRPHESHPFLGSKGERPGFWPCAGTGSAVDPVEKSGCQGEMSTAGSGGCAKGGLLSL